MIDTPLDALPPGATNVGAIDVYRAWNDQPLRYRTVVADVRRFSLVYLHGIESHGAWFLPVAAQLARHGCTTYLLDRRGSGLNRDTHPGDAPHADALIADVQRFRRHLGDDEPIHLAALSWGGKLALAAALEQPQHWRSLSLITPGLRAKVDLPLHHKAAVALNLALGGAGRFPIPIKPDMFTRTPPLLAFICHDPWRLSRVTARFLRASRALDLRILQSYARLPMPVLLLLAERDRIIDNRRVRRMARHVQPDARIFTFPAAEHAIVLDHPAAVAEQIISHLRNAAPARVHRRLESVHAS